MFYGGGVSMLGKVALPFKTLLASFKLSDRRDGENLKGIAKIRMSWIWRKGGGGAVCPQPPDDFSCSFVVRFLIISEPGTGYMLYKVLISFSLT